MAKVRYDLDHDELVRLYVNEHYTLRQLQGVFNMRGSHLRTTLNYLGILKHVSGSKGGLQKPYISDYEIYINQQESQYRRGAKRRGVSYELSTGEFKNLIESNCYYCNSKPSIKHEFSRLEDNVFYRNGIDRLDNNIGYIPSNVVCCCKICNVAKNDMSEEDFYTWINNVFTHTNRKGE